MNYRENEHMKKEMLINVLQPEECRIAILEDGVLEELYVERTSQESYVGNIYKGRIVNIEPSIQAAFVDFGIGRNGFLHVSDVDPAYYRHLESGGEGREDRRGGGRDRRGERGPRRGERRGDRSDRGRAEPVGGVPAASAPATAAPQAEPEREFGAGIDLFSDEQMTLTAGDAAQPQGATGEPGPDAAVEAEAPPRRRRGRRRRGSGRGEPAAADESTPSPAEAGSTPEAGQVSEEEPQDRPPSLETAERRTDEGDDSFAGTLGDPFAGDENRADADDEQIPDTEIDEPEDDVPLSPAAEGDVLPGDDAADDFPPRRSGRDRDRGRDRGRPRGRRPLGRDGLGRPKPPIQDIFRRGQEVIIQVIKEGIGTKGPTLSTYISIAGRYLVLMPGLNRIGVSRKIADDEARRRLRDILAELNPPKGVGFIIRTAGVDRNKKELQNDLGYLLRIWQVVVRRIKKLKAPGSVYQESDMITRTIRDTFTSDIDTIWVDEPVAFAHAQEFLQGVMPRYANRIKLYEGTEPLFHRYRIEEEIARIQQRKVPLPHGGSIVIEQTEALVAIDVNSGSFRADNNAEETAYQMNLHAAREIARQLRLRDLGGVIINDFIDMRDEKHRRGVEKALRDAVKRDRARTKVLKISQFGIIEMTRQRIRPSLKRSVYQDCPYCHGTAQVKTVESMSIDVMRLLQLAAHRENVARIQAKVQADVAIYLLNRKRREIAQLEESGDIQVTITGVPGAPPETMEMVCYDTNNNEVKLVAAEPGGRAGGRYQAGGR
jgi:ribonuclease E